MKSSNTSSWESNSSQKLSIRTGIGEEALITSSTRELVEFYWSTRKRLLEGQTDFSVKQTNYREKLLLKLKILLLNIIGDSS
tara:strand:- start:437 stop:682 length:246 start_codon:yes stop_codon:yes gene_type:complete